jgi:hypothetical protein
VATHQTSVRYPTKQVLACQPYIRILNYR